MEEWIFYSFSATDRVQDINFNQLKLKVNDTYKKIETLTTNFEPSNEEVKLNKTYLDTKFLKIDCQMSNIEKMYNEFKLHKSKKSIEGVLIGRAVKKTLQILYDMELSDNHDNADEVLEGFLFIEEFNDRRRPDLEEVNDVVVQWFYS